MLLEDLEIPQLVTRPAKQPLPSAKPGLAAPPTRFSNLPFLVRWTHYGMWDDEGSTVLDQRGHLLFKAHQGIRRTTRPAPSIARHLATQSPRQTARGKG